MNPASELAKVADTLEHLDQTRAGLIAERNRLIRVLHREGRSTRNIAEVARVSAMTVSLVVNR